MGDNKEKEVMDHEIEIRLMNQEIKTLSDKVESLGSAIEKYDKAVHGHIERKMSTDIKLALSEMEKRISDETDRKINDRLVKFQATLKTWGFILLFGVSGTVGVTNYMTGQVAKSQNNIKEIAELYKVISQENRKNAKQTEVIMNPSRTIP